MGNDMSAISRLTAEEVQAEEDATVARINAGTREGQDAENKQFATAMRARTELKAAEKRAVELAKVNDVEEGEVDEDPSNPLDAWQPRKDKVSPIKVPTKPTPGPTPIATSSGIKQLVNREKPKAASDGPDSTSSAHKQPLITTTKPGLATTRLPAVKLPAVNTQSKRPAPSAFADERRPVAKSSKRTENASPRSPGEPVENKTRKSKPSRETPVLAEISERPPAWYQALQVVQRRGNADEASASPLIESLKDYTFQKIRDSLHKLMFEKVSGQLLRNRRILHDQDGLPQIFDKKHSGDVVYPWDVVADAEELYNKWCLQDFETDLLRGIVRGAPASKNVERRVDSIDEKYKGRASWIFHGNGLLLNGQWWPTQLTTVRDGAHGAMIAGISGAAGEGAYSCVMSSGHGYEDEDHGEWVLYCGTDSTDGKITDATLRMLESKENGKPVRIIRSHNLHSPFAPEIGFRYDGLYKVVSSKALDKSDSTRRRHQFRLERVLGQAPIRSQEPEKRPTAQEIKAHKDDKEKRNLA
ncbi:ubiquitin-like with PHD and RING finger domains 2 [Elasticomyces elasticus]|nr:ubiquitin-like with PHD and RING finger domains 2 [Elasticomyces elasticus]KAK3624984.1 ubiquitin-like with PHD and RING finger domains 2 [Elasticomyces elasticus]KAK5768109.1 ubiquitin-like with PHD and RING finger domains 2 [Elasticomyces elasticus]